MVHPIHVPKRPDPVSGLQPRLVRRAARVDAIHFRERRLDECGIPRGGRSSLLLGRAGGCDCCGRRGGGVGGERSLVCGVVVVEARFDARH